MHSGLPGGFAQTKLLRNFFGQKYLYKNIGHMEASIAVEITNAATSKNPLKIYGNVSTIFFGGGPIPSLIATNRR
jgi:hypothetical protein